MSKSQRRMSKAICLDEWEKQIILGSLLGNAFIADPKKGLHCYLVLRQSSSRDINAILYKVEELKAFARKTGVLSYKYDHRWASISHQDFDVIKDFCYKGGKKEVTMEWLNVLKDVSLMSWYLDRGFYKNGQLGLKVIKGSEKVTEQYFNEVGMSCRSHGATIVFDEKGKLAFLKVIAHRVPQPLHYVLESDEKSF